MHLELLLLCCWSGFYFWFFLRCFFRYIDCELSLHSQVGDNVHLSNFLGFEINFKPYILDEIRSFNSEGTLLTIDWEGKGVKRQFACKPLFVIFHRVVMKVEVSSCVKEHSIHSWFFSNNSRVRKSKRFKLTNPISPWLTNLSRDLASDIFSFDLLFLGRLSYDLSFGGLNSLLNFAYLFLNLLNFGLSTCNPFLNHFVDPLKISNFFFKFGIAFFSAWFEPLRVDLLLALKFGKGAVRPFGLAAFDFGESRLLNLNLLQRNVTFCSRSLTL